jgi:hypothetical protein
VWQVLSFGVKGSVRILLFLVLNQKETI